MADGTSQNLVRIMHISSKYIGLGIMEMSGTRLGSFSKMKEFREDLRSHGIEREEIGESIYGLALAAKQLNCARIIGKK